MSNLKIHQFNCRDDNFGVLIHDPDAGVTAAIDTPDEVPVRAAIEETGWGLTHIITTHHHFDHVKGNEPLKAEFSCHIIGPEAEADRIPGIDQTVNDGDQFQFGNHTVAVISTPGHTLGQVNYHFADAGVAFTGDTLFALGCGRIFEGDPDMMWSSLSKLMQLPEETVIYCGHEYTHSNARFALTVDPDNEALQARAAEIEALRADGKPTLPTTMAQELKTNPFLRASDPAIRAHLGMEDATDAQVFAEIRARKDKG